MTYTERTGIHLLARQVPLQMVSEETDAASNRCSRVGPISHPASRG
jgi:hypothetical protein